MDWKERFAVCVEIAGRVVPELRVATFTDRGRMIAIIGDYRVRHDPTFAEGEWLFEELDPKPTVIDAFDEPEPAFSLLVAHAAGDLFDGMIEERASASAL